MIWLHAVINGVLAFQIVPPANSPSTYYFADDLSLFLVRFRFGANGTVGQQPKPEHAVARSLLAESEMYNRK